jgi:uroporphyrinogen-III synthase
MKDYVAAMELQTSGSLEKLLDQYKITWTLLPPDSSAVALLDHLPQWRRVYADKAAVVHAKATN